MKTRFPAQHLSSSCAAAKRNDVSILEMKPRYFPLLFLLLTTPLFANDAAMNDGNLGPIPLGWTSGLESIIQMKEEHLDIHFGIKESKVKVRFTFVSHKKNGVAKQKLGFPNMSRTESEFFPVGPIENLVTKVNGKVVESPLFEGYYEEKIDDNGKITYEERPKPADPDVPFYSRDDMVRRYAWYILDLEFPPGEEVIVEREYTCPSGTSAMSYSFFIYETRTGGAWRGDIEKLTAKVTFDDSVRRDLIGFEPKDGWVLSEDGESALLEWSNFEPRTDDDRQYFMITSIDLERVEKQHAESPDLPSVEEVIATWRKEFQPEKAE